ncbi:MAG: cellulase family glycosylhydrolase [Lachnospiraceae bacterium]|nr:cellulase family glycosylhydrolase [Lachnospiraceae bacterium]
MLKKVRVWIVAVMAILMISLLACSDITGVAEVVSEGNNDSTEVLSETESESETDTETSENTPEESDSEDETLEEVKEEASEENTTAESGTPFEMHGALKVDGTNVVDANGDVFQIAGVSTHGLAWFPDYVNKDAFMSIRDDWGANTIRLAMYTAENGGYCEGGNKDNLKALVKDGVNYATELGMYVIVDWHILHDLDPNKYKSDAIAFFDEMSREFKDQDNVIYEICNEPNGGTSWSQVKSYALEVIPVIRANDPNAIIIVGTPNWCQFVDDAANDPITEYDNLLYAVHFYAETHRDDIRNRMTTAINKGLPVIISEFSICDASGNGRNNIDQANIWIDLLDQYNVGFVAWNLSNKAESSSLIASGCQKKSGWTYDELSESGKWYVGVLNEHSDNGAGILNGQAPVTTGNNSSNNGGNSGNGSANNNNANNNQQAALPSGSGSGNNLYATVSASNSWESGSGHCTQLNVSIENKGSSAASGWTVEIDLGQSATIDQIWCAVGTVNGNIIILTPESFNGTIEGGKTVSDIGLIITTSGSVSSTTVSVK